MTAKTIFIPHGGGPLPLLGDPQHAGLTAFLRTLPDRLPRPDAIVLISAHHEGPEIIIGGAEKPDMIYDYNGFPAETYEYRYDAPGAPALAAEVADHLAQAGVAARIDPDAGFDHGVFVPLMLMYPKADIPVLTVSLSSSLDAGLHLAEGKALSFLKERNVLILGSGLSFHNMRSFFRPTRESMVASENFHDWLVEILTSTGLTPAAREQALAAWDEAPDARVCQPREEHLLPLHVCAGFASAAGQTAEIIFDEPLIRHRAIAVLWQ
ncbi:dioxygenase [Parvularcula flava]|uniref:Dioxygenase n=1 Tax=Aquisalinus luteolus TaxID=1566827 RepID=A0A8J3ERW8_9PROT|nr:class III extradiol ring-cleavage dioxygenase [Aquisalinus luteolus]NHK29030.1 dioxygenase [Aquisalinus luteolus]GGI00525.1 dioxygenase [Aquisalinus luteolus]